MKGAGTTVVVITHKLNILSVVDKIVILGDGMVQAVGSKEEVLRRLTAPKAVRTDSPALSQEPAVGDMRATAL